MATEKFNVGTVVKVLGEVGSNGKKGCRVCGATGLTWVRVKLPDGTEKPRIVPTNSIQHNGGAITADLSGNVHGQVYSVCERETREKAANAGNGEVVAPVTQIVQEFTGDVSIFNDKLTAIEDKVNHLDAFTAKLDERQGEMAPAIKAVTDIIKTELDGMRSDIQKYRTSAPVTVQIKDVSGATLATKNLGRVHAQLANLIVMTEAVRGVGMVYMVGEAGSFKSTAFKQLADALNQRHMVYTAGPMMTEIDIFGFRNANGDPVDPWGFADFYENGGLICIDEIGNGSPNGLTAFNGLTSNHEANFSKGMVAKHANTYFVVADNTYGRGADPLYVGRNQLDAATLSRMVYLPWDTDWDFLTGSLGLDDVSHKDKGFPAPGKPRSSDDPEVKGWAQYVRKVYDAVQSTNGGVRAVISSRAVINGKALLEAGIHRGLVEYSTMWAHMSSQDAVTIKSVVKA